MMQTILKKDEQAAFALRELYGRYGYMPYKMSRFEEYDLYVRNKDFVVSDQIITFAGRSGKLLALKPDVTLSIVKNAPEVPDVVQKLYYNENVYRTDAGSHAVKEIMQAGLECVGDLGSYEIAEVVLLAAKSLQLLGNDFVLDISHMGLVAAVLDGCTEAQAKNKEILRCLHQKSSHELAALCAGFPDSISQKLQTLVSSCGKPEEAICALESVLTTPEEQAAFAELKDACMVLRSGGFADCVRVDFSVGNNMKYYSGVVFKGYLKGVPSSILSGGQYDKLPQRMGRKSRAIGFAIYLDLLERQGVNPGSLDVDTVILHSRQTDPVRLIVEAEKAAQYGSVLVCTQLPKDRRWKKIVEIT